MRVSLIINDMMISEADPKASNLENTRPDGRLYELVPNSFVLYTHHKIPQIIKNEIEQASQNPASFIDYGFLNDDEVAFFSFDKNLYLWMYPQQQIETGMRIIENYPSKFTMDNTITSVCVAQPLPGMEYIGENKILILSTLGEIKIFKYSKNMREHKIDLEDTKFSLPTDQQVINKIIQVQKNGRVFYGGTSGHINELKYEQSTKFDVFSLMYGEKKKLKKNDLTEQSLISKLIPSFFKLHDKKTVTDIKIDEQRNILYSVSISMEQSSKDDVIIEVYDLGILCSKFNKITSISQQQIVESLVEFWQKDKSIKKSDIKKLTLEHKIVYVKPISVSESEKWQLMIVTSNGYRIYLGFETESSTHPTNEELAQPMACSDYLHYERPTRKWNIMEVLHFPDQTSYQDLNFLNQKPSLFNCGKLQSVVQNPGFENEQLHYNSNEGVLAFIQNNEQNRQTTVFNEVDFTDRIIVNIIKRNDSSISYKKLLVEGGSLPNIQNSEIYSQVHIPYMRQQIRGMQTPNQLRTDEHIAYIQESVIEIQSKVNVVTLEENKLLGIKTQYNNKKGMGASPYYGMFSLSEFEKQLYMMPVHLNILTDNRIIQLHQLRPIDMLQMILSLMLDSKFEARQAFNLEEFMDSYSIRETCGMLLQLILEKEAHYLCSRKFEEQLLKNDNNDLNQGNTRPQYVSKSTQIMRQSKRTSVIYSTNDHPDVVKYRKITPEVRQLALDILRKYGDCVLLIRKTFEITKESIEGVPANLQDFSLKHYVLYQYLHRVLRPIWSIKLGYRLPGQNDKGYRCSFDSLNVPKAKLLKLLDFIGQFELDLSGENYNPSNRGKDSFFKIQELADIAKPVYMLPQLEKNKLELMEKNSIKNLKQFIQRSIEGIELLSVLTHNFDQKFFESVQKQVDNQDIIQEFCDTSFKELVTLENNIILRRILEASVQVETQGSLEAQTKMRQIYGGINKVCKSFFSLSENITFIGITLLQTAKKEKSQQRKEELLKQAVDHLSDQPLNIDMSVVPFLLVDNGNYTTLADLTLRKLKALESLKLEQRERLMTKSDYESAKDECYSIILSLFAAIDLSITKTAPPQATNKGEQDQIQYFLTKLNVVQDDTLKVHLRDRIMKRIELFNDEVVLTALFDYLISRPNIKFNMGALPNLSDKSLLKICDQVISEVSIPRYKFDAVVQILMKKKEAERLMNLARNACYDQYRIEKPSQSKVPALSLNDKYNLVHTALVLLEDQRASFSQDVYSTYARQLQDLKESIESQLIVVQNLEEMVDTINRYYQSNQNPDRYQLDQEYLKSLQAAKDQLLDKLLTKDEQAKFCQRLQIQESSLRFSIARIDKGERPLVYVQDAIEGMIEFFMIFASDQIFTRLTSKIPLIINYQNHLLSYLKNIQQCIDNKFRDTSTAATELRILETDRQFTGTRFQLFSYCYSNLIMTLPPSLLYRELCPQNTFIRGQNQFSSEEDLGALITQMAILKCWIYLNQSIFGSDPVQQIIGQDEASKFQTDLRNNYETPLRDIRQVQVKFNEAIIMLLPREGNVDVGKTLKNLYIEIEDQFLQMLSQHGIQPHIDSRYIANHSSFLNVEVRNEGFRYPELLPPNASASSLNYSASKISQLEESKGSSDQNIQQQAHLLYQESRQPQINAQPKLIITQLAGPYSSAQPNPVKVIQDDDDDSQQFYI